MDFYCCFQGISESVIIRVSKLLGELSRVKKLSESTNYKSPTFSESERITRISKLLESENCPSQWIIRVREPSQSANYLENNQSKRNFPSNLSEQIIRVCKLFDEFDILMSLNILKTWIAKLAGNQMGYLTIKYKTIQNVENFFFLYCELPIQPTTSHSNRELWHKPLCTKGQWH